MKNVQEGLVPLSKMTDARNKTLETGDIVLWVQSGRGSPRDVCRVVGPSSHKDRDIEVVRMEGYYAGKHAHITTHNIYRLDQ